MKGQRLAVAVVLIGMVFAVLPFAAVAEEQPLVNLLFFDTSIREALSEISLQTGINIIPDGTVSGTITVDLQDVPLDKALRMILVGGGFSYRKIDDDFYLVGLPDPRSTTFGELVETEVVQLRYLTVAQVTAAMPQFLASYVRGESAGRMLTITAPPSEIERIKTFLNQIDKPKQQVEVKVVVTEVASSRVNELGANLFEYVFGAGQTVNNDWSGGIGYSGGLLTLATDIYGTLLTELRLMEQQRDATIHADPKVLVADGSTATIFVGDRQVLLLESEGTAQRVERIEVGMNLSVTPTILGDGEVLLNISPEISHFVNGNRANLVIKESNVSTTVRLKAGQTAVLAGMTVQEDSELVSKVPVLGDIPLLGWLFRKDTTQVTDRELMVFVTPVIHEF